MGKGTSTKAGTDKKKDVAKKVGIVVLAKRAIGKITKLAVVAGIGAAVVKVLRGEQKTGA